MPETTKVSLRTAIGDGNIVDADLLYIIDTGSSVPSKKAAMSSVYTYIYDKLIAAAKLVPTLPASASVFLDGTGNFSTPPNTSYSVFDESSTGLVPIGATAANHNGEYLRKDASFVKITYIDVPTGSTRPTLSLIDSPSGGWTTVVQPSTSPEYVDMQIYTHEYKNGSWKYDVHFQWEGELTVSAYDSDPTIDVSIDLSGLTFPGGAPAIDVSAGELNRQFFPVIMHNLTNRTYWYGLGYIDGTTVTISDVATDFGSDGGFNVRIAGDFTYNMI